MDSREEQISEPSQPAGPNGTHCPLCGKELVPDERTYPWGTSITLYECPDQCALAAP